MGWGWQTELSSACAQSERYKASQSGWIHASFSLGLSASHSKCGSICPAREKGVEGDNDVYSTLLSWTLPSTPLPFLFFPLCHANPCLYFSISLSFMLSPPISLHTCTRLHTCIHPYCLPFYTHSCLMLPLSWPQGFFCCFLSCLAALLVFLLPRQRNLTDFLLWSLTICSSFSFALFEIFHLLTESRMDGNLYSPKKHLHMKWRRKNFWMDRWNRHAEICQEVWKGEVKYREREKWGILGLGWDYILACKD